MKANIFIISILVLFLSAGCDEFLEEKTFEQMTPELLFESYENAQLAVNGLYIAHFEERLGQQMFWPAFWSARCQEFSFYGENTGNDLKWTSGESQLYWHWRALYKAQNACNTAVDGITNMDPGLITDEQRNELLAEARFMRAHGYYHLLKYWGGVPLLVEPTANPETAALPRSSAQTIFEFIEEDLKFAQQYLPVNWNGGFPDQGRCTKGSATATLAQLYALVSGEQFKGNDAVGGDPNFNNIAQDYWSEAQAELKSLIDETDPSMAKAPYLYHLEPDLANLYSGGTNAGGLWVPVREMNDLGPEIIWSTTYDPDINDGTWMFNHWGNRYISPYILDMFEPNGYRAAVKHDSAHQAAKGYIVCAHVKRNRTGNDNENQFYFARYGGMLLLAAYVENEVNNGPTQFAEDCLNAIRARARAGDGVTTYTVPEDVASGLSYEAFKEEVMDERAVELFYEYKFWNDIIMSGRMERDWAIIASGETGSRDEYRKQWKLLPIPERDIIASGGLLEQNAGH